MIEQFPKKPGRLLLQGQQNGAEEGQIQQTAYP